MFDLPLNPVRLCDGLRRRDFLRVGSLPALGLGLPQLLAAEDQVPPASRSDMNCILLWMGGGPSNMDTFDLKPDAPVEYRGEFSPIDTNVPGVQVCEYLPQMSRCMDRVCLVKSVTHPSTVHGQADHFMLTGYQSVPPIPTNDIRALMYPSYGSVLGREKGWRDRMPPYVSLGSNSVYYGSGYMGSTFDPLRIAEDPNAADFSIKDVSIAAGVGSERTERRGRMLAALDRWQKQADGKATSLLERDAFYRQAYDLLTSPRAKQAFNLQDEPDALRDRYGRNIYGQRALLARRLIEAGVRWVNIEMTRWDTHQNNFATLKSEHCLGSLDQFWPVLLEDLDDRGLLQNTVVIWMGEFGRTPKVNGQGGRDHWGMSNAIAFSGAGIRMGTVVGETDRHCSAPVGLSHSTFDLAATVYHLLGIDRHKEYRTPDNRPVLINHGGTPIAEVLA